MQNIFINRSLHLRTGELATVQINGAIKLQIGKGRVWITMEGAPDDYWLSGGEQIEIAVRGMLVVEGADASSQVQLGLPQQHWFARLTATLRGLRRPADRRVTGCVQAAR